MYEYVLYNNESGVLMSETEANSEKEALELFKKKFPLPREWREFDFVSLRDGNGVMYVVPKSNFINYLMEACDKPLFR